MNVHKRNLLNQLFRPSYPNPSVQRQRGRLSRFDGIGVARSEARSLDVIYQGTRSLHNSERARQADANVIASAPQLISIIRRIRRSHLGSRKIVSLERSRR